MSALELQRVESNGRTFVLRQFDARTQFPFEVSERRDGICFAHESYSLLSLAQMDLARRVRDVERLATVSSYDPERPDRYRMDNLPDTYMRYGEDR